MGQLPPHWQACWAVALSEQQACWAVAMSEQHAAARLRCAALRHQTQRGPLLAVPVWLPAPPAASAMGQLPPLWQACWAVAPSEQQAYWAMAMSEQHAAAQLQCAALRHQTRGGPLLAVPVWLPVPPAGPAVGRLPPHWQACWAVALSEQQAYWAVAMSEQHAAARLRCAALRHQTQRGPLLAVPVWLPAPPAASAMGQLPPLWQACWVALS